jgi:hypothetical protein
MRIVRNNIERGIEVMEKEGSEREAAVTPMPPRTDELRFGSSVGSRRREARRALPLGVV